MPVILFDGPEGPERHELPYGPNGLPRLMSPEVIHIQRVTDMTVVDWWNAIVDRSPDAVAVTALVQVVWKRQGRVVKFDDVSFDYSTWDVDLLPEERPKTEPTAEADPGPDPTSDSSGSPTAEG